MKTLATYRHLLWLFGLIRLNLTNPIWTNWKQFLSVPWVVHFYRRWMQMCLMWHSWCYSLSSGWEIKGNWEHIFRVFWGLCFWACSYESSRGKKNTGFVVNKLVAFLQNTGTIIWTVAFAKSAFPREQRAPKISRWCLAAFRMSE